MRMYVGRRAWSIFDCLSEEKKKSERMKLILPSVFNGFELHWHKADEERERKRKKAREVKHEREF